MNTDGKPRHVFQWHITHACNLRCGHCYQDDYQISTPEKQLYSVLDKYTDFVRQNGFYGQINLTGGEPLLHPAFFRLAEEIKRRGFRLGILTNGTLIDEDMADRIHSVHPVFVQISLDGSPAIHDNIRGKGAFRKALCAIRLLKKRGTRVLVSFTAQKSNLKSFRRLARICSRCKVDKLWWDRVVTDSPEAQSVLALSTEEFRRFLICTKKLEKKYRRQDGSSMVSNERSLQFLGCRSVGNAYECSAGKKLFAVLADGTVLPCRRLPLEIGNIFESSFDALLCSSPVIDELRGMTYPKECSGCLHRRCCSGGAKCITYAQTGELDKKDPNCFLEIDALCGRARLKSSLK